MLNFTFFNPTKIVFGKDQLQELDTLVPEKARVLITYGGGSAKRSGVLDRVKTELDKSDRTVFEFGGIEANPEFTTLMKAVEICRTEKIDFLLAVAVAPLWTVPSLLLWQQLLMNTRDAKWNS